MSSKIGLVLSTMPELLDVNTEFQNSVLTDTTFTVMFRANSLAHRNAAMHRIIRHVTQLHNGENITDAAADKVVVCGYIDNSGLDTNHPGVIFVTAISDKKGDVHEVMISLVLHTDCMSTDAVSRGDHLVVDAHLNQNSELVLVAEGYSQLLTVSAGDHHYDALTQSTKVKLPCTYKGALTAHIIN